MPSFETPGRVGLRVTVPAGAVVVDTWEEPRTEVEVTAVRGDDASQRAAAETRIEVTERGDKHEIVVRAPKPEGRFGFLSRGADLHVAIRCPEGADVELSTHSADLEARGTTGEVTVRSASGDVSLGDARALWLTTASGDVTAGAIAGPVTAKGASGDVDIRSVGGSATINTVSGDIRLGPTEDTVAVNTVSGDVELGATGGAVRISAVSGDVDVATRPGLALWIDAQSVSGTMRSELEVADLPAADAGESPVELRVRTVSGDVRISRATSRVA